MANLKLVALEDQDLIVISAHVQDAVTHVGQLRYAAAERRFILPINRFAWETQQGLFPKRPERRNAVLHFDRVMAATTSGLDRGKKADALSLLALRFLPAEAPAGTVELVFAGQATIRLSVECIEARLTDLGGAWQATSRPRHGA